MDYQDKLILSKPDIKYFINYPFNKDLLLFNNPNVGFKRVFDNSLVWQSFIRRKDAFAYFFILYKKQNIEELISMKNIDERNNTLFLQFFLEKLVSETSFIEKLDKVSKNKLMQMIFERHIKKCKFLKEYLGFTYNSSLGSIIKILENIEKMVIINLNLN